MNKIEYKRVRELFNYEDGSLVWRVDRGARKVKGLIAGSLVSKGYLQVQVDNKRYLVHRLIFLWHHGYLPENGLDHIDRDKLNNSIENLREVSRTCNLRNCGNHKDNTSGVKGVSWNKHANKWIAKITVMGKQNYIGSYSDFDVAVLARLDAEQGFGWMYCDRSSPAHLYATRNNLRC